jgi:hypothetical protein
MNFSSFISFVLFWLATKFGDRLFLLLSQVSWLVFCILLK